MNFKRRKTIEENNELPKGTTIASQIQMSLDFHFTIVIMLMTSSAFGGGFKIKIMKEGGSKPSAPRSLHSGTPPLFFLAFSFSPSSISKCSEH